MVNIALKMFEGICIIMMLVFSDCEEFILLYVWLTVSWQSPRLCGRPGRERNPAHALFSKGVMFLFEVYLFLSDLYAPRGAPIHDPKVRSCPLC